MVATVTDRIYGESSSVAVKAPVRAVATVALATPLTGLPILGGIAVAPGDRVLVTAQPNAVDNGIYVASTSAWQRAGDFSGSFNVVNGTLVIQPLPNGPAAFYQAQGVPQSGFMVPGTDPITFTLLNAGQIYAPGDPRHWNGVGNGLTDDTAAVQSAFSIGGDITIADGLIYLVKTITLTASVRVRGAGTIRQSANPGVSMIYAPAANAGLSFDCGNVTYDGNVAAQGVNPPNITVDFRSAGTAANPTIFRAVGAKFINSGVADIRIWSNQVGGLIKALIDGSDFFGGAQGDAAFTYFPRAIDVADAVDFVCVNSDFTLGAAINKGKAGIVTYFNQAEASPTQFSQFVRAKVAFNTFDGMGRDQANGQGCIDFYGYTADSYIIGNTMRNFACRGAAVKGSDARIVIAHNILDTAAAGLAFIVTGIVCNASTTNDLFSDLIIDSNIVLGMTGDAIYVNGQNLSGNGTRAGVCVKGNIVRGCGSSGVGRDIALQACVNADILDNQCYSNGAANSIGLILCVGVIGLRRNRIITPAGRAVLLNGGDNNSAAYLEIDGNTVDTPGSNAVGCAYYLSTVGGVNYSDTNRTLNANNATPVLLDSSASFNGTIAGNVLTVTAIGLGTIMPGHVLTAPGTAAANVSVPGITISPYGTGGTTGVGGVGTYQLSAAPAGIAVAQAFNTTGVAAGTPPAPRALVMNNNTLGTVTVTANAHLVDTYNGQAAGNLYWINGGYPGQRVTFALVNSGRVVTFKDNAANLANGNINIGADWVPGAALAAGKASITLVYTGTDWKLVAKD